MAGVGCLVGVGKLEGQVRSWLLLSAPLNDWYNTAGYAARIMLGDATLGPNTIANLKKINIDPVIDSWKGPYMRFRHQKNTVGNFLFADGHVKFTASTRCRRSRHLHG